MKEGFEGKALIVSTGDLESLNRDGERGRGVCPVWVDSERGVEGGGGGDVDGEGAGGVEGEEEVDPRGFVGLRGDNEEKMKDKDLAMVCGRRQFEDQREEKAGDGGLADLLSVAEEQFNLSNRPECHVSVQERSCRNEEVVGDSAERGESRGVRKGEDFEEQIPRELYGERLKIGLLKLRRGGARNPLLESKLLEERSASSRSSWDVEGGEEGGRVEVSFLFILSPTKPLFRSESPNAHQKGCYLCASLPGDEKIERGEGAGVAR